jgi:hypothetical protein
MRKGNLFNITNAASRSAVPLPWNTSVVTIRPFRFSTKIAVIAELGFLAIAFARQQGVGIGGGLTGVVGPRLAMKVNCRIARMVRQGVLFAFPGRSSGWPALRAGCTQKLAPADRIDTASGKIAWR